MLRYYILQKDLQDSYKGLWPAAREGSKVALDALAKLAAINSDFYWLEKAASLQNVHAQIALAELSEGKDRVFWWQQAAINGHGPSQFELSLLVESTEQRIRYLEQAAMNEHTPAIIALSKYYFENGDANNAIRWLRKAAEFDESSSYKLAKMLWKKGYEAEAELAFIKSSTSNPIALGYVKILKASSRTKLSVLIDNTSLIPEQCAQQLQFVATSLDTAVQAANFKSAYEQDQRLRALPICIKPIIWLAANELNCELVGNRKECDLRAVAKQTFMPSYTHLVFFLDEGKAYVHDGAMYLDEADTYSVFVHELAHFVGFVDEYAVSIGLAQQYCYKTDAPNLLLSDDTDLYQMENFQLWQRYYQELMMTQANAVDEGIDKKDITEKVIPSLEIGLSRTCASLNLKTYKPASRLTFMEYHDTRNIPPIYLLMWKDLLTKNHHAIAVSALFETNAQRAKNLEATKYWSSFY
ncbi:MAG: hypothetical protein ACJAVV_000006 [Alphaproteobacteria bacterium]|jgi:hypothetical protein